jgi:hypothetical protein
MIRLMNHQHSWVEVYQSAEDAADAGLEELAGTLSGALLRAFNGVQDILTKHDLSRPDKIGRAQDGMSYLSLSVFIRDMVTQQSGELIDGVGAGRANTIPEFNRDEAGSAIARLHSSIQENDEFFEDSRDEKVVWYRNEALYVSREPSVPNEALNAHLRGRKVEVDFSQLEMITPYVRYGQA